MKYYLFGIALTLTTFSCTKEEPEVYQATIQSSIQSAPINLDELQIGDEYNYILFQAESYFDADNSNIVYTKDTLNVEVCGFKDGRYIVSESITAGSEMFTNGETYYYTGPDSIFTNYWHVRNDSLIIEQKDNNNFYSHLFHGWPPSLNLQEFTDNEVGMNGWKIDLPYTVNNFEAHVIDGEIGGTTYPFLNVLTLNFAMAFDGDGLTHIYNREDGIVSSSIYSGWTSQGIGWELIK